MPFRVAPFRIDVGSRVLDDLHERLRRTRWPDPAPGPAWSQGTDLSYLRALVDHWTDGFDWRSQEERLNRYEHFVADIDDVRIHFVHQRSGKPPLVLSHGWPSTFAEMLPLVDRLADRFDLVVPSLPGYCFSSRPPRVGLDRDHVAGLWHRLMQGLGYDRYGATGGDFGAGVATAMALTDPDRMIGIYLSTTEVLPFLGAGSAPLTHEERTYLDHLARWDETERGYSAIQSTRPQTLGYALNDSPVGLAAWLVEKWRSWSDCGGDLDAHIERDDLLTTITLYWATGSITSSMRDYFDNRWHGSALGPQDRVAVPTGIGVFANEFVPEGLPPRSLLERLYDVRRWTVHPRGGHFAAAEVPDLLAADIAAHFDALEPAR
ncbi:MAG TPA: epoxide hydrolase [Candidatus Nanopelagicales bacterium]|nr:epoxide hydrolase [Candidatus Nanopelagicales bacterium]